MRPPRFLHIGIAFRYLPPPLEQVQALDQAIASESFDWMRYSYSCYVVWSSSDTETICRKILRVSGMKESSSVFICEIDINSVFAFLQQWAWEWLKKDRGYGPLVTWTPEPEPPLLTEGLPKPPGTR